MQGKARMPRRVPRREPRILLGITGGIAAYKVPQLIRLLKKNGADVKTVCTAGALRFVGDETLRGVSGHPVYRDGAAFHDVDHIRLSAWADLFIICPATANTIAKMAHGIADNLLTTLALSVPPEKTAVAPAMNTAMWENRATRENVAALKKRGVTVLPVGTGELACGTSGPGRMLEAEAIVDFVMSRFPASGALSGKRVLISSGPTEEPLDPVRMITNRSSGKMGAALARAALREGAKVTVVSGPARAALPAGVRVVRVRTAHEMRKALLKEFASADLCIMAAAVSDFRPVRTPRSKIKRHEGGTITLALAANPDILAELGRRKGAKVLVGFALETGAGEKSAKRKMAEKKCDMMIVNRVDEALERDTTKMTILDRDGGAEACPVMDKARAAALIIQRVAARR
jgi:phosphopantothenoylcysteine decarboxylase/phosphopantothenate--cysteine ligase